MGDEKSEDPKILADRQKLKIEWMANLPNAHSAHNADDNAQLSELKPLDPNPQENLVELFNQSPSLNLQISQRLSQVKDAFAIELIKDYEMGNLTNFTPVLLALGSIAYFQATAEPNLFALVVTALLLFVGAWRLQANLIAFHLVAAFSLIFTGMIAAKLQTIRSEMPIPNSQITTMLSGIVLKVDQNRRGAPRYILRPTSIEGFENQHLPKRIRLSSSSKKYRYLPGQTVNGLARLSPVSGPAYPGGYDFAFHAWFKGQGQSGFFMGSPNLSKHQVQPNALELFEIKLNQLREGIGQRIKIALPNSSGAIATALITGDRTGMSEELQDGLRRSGLAHILAISGLHMALVTLTVVWLVRFLLVLPRGLAERYPIKKWGLLAGVIIATSYLFISGASVATQRAWLMISVMLIAGLLDRRAITMRSVAIAASIIILIFPSSVFEPGFQMSFAAVVALVGFYRSWNLYRQNRYKRTDMVYKNGPLRKASFYLAGLGTTSLIAGTATALIAAYHFHRVALFGLVTNLAAMPIVSLLVMPLALLSLLLMPYGFEQLALKPLGHSIELVVWISDSVNAHTANFYTGAKPKLFLAATPYF